jgi:hypothetical protein
VYFLRACPTSGSLLVDHRATSDGVYETGWGPVGQVAAVLQARGVRCFYDADEEIDLWGKYLAEELPTIYGERAAAVVVFVSAEYAARDWTRLERRAALGRAVRERREYVLPARFDDTTLPGMISDMHAVDLRARSPEQFAAMIADKLAALGITAPAPSERAGSPPQDVEAVPGHVLWPARSADLTIAQLRATAAAISATPQLATERGREALMEALQGVIGPIARTDDPEADLLDLVSAVLDRQAGAALFGALLDIAASENERIAAVATRHRWELQAAVAPLLRMLRRTPLVDVLGALAGTVGDVPAGITDFDQVLELLADLRASRLAASSLAEFVVRLQQRRPDVEVPGGWFSSQGLGEAALAALRTSVAKEAGMRRKLVIDLRDSTPGAWQAALTGYLGPCWYTRTVKCEPTADGVRGAVVKVIEWARSQAADFVIGFLLRLGMLRELPELWEYEDMVITPTRLCEEYPVVLHAAERMTIRQLQQAWDGKLAEIEASAGAAPSILWLDQDDATAIRRAVQQSHDAYVAFSFVPQIRPDLRATALMAAIAAGAPYLIWVQAAPANGYDLRTRLGGMVGPIRDFPSVLRQCRRSDPYLSQSLRVIWDRLDELPPYLERLGEELVSNG